MDRLLGAGEFGLSKLVMQMKIIENIHIFNR